MTHVRVVPVPPVPQNSEHITKQRFLTNLEFEIYSLAAKCQEQQQQRKPLSSFAEDDDHDEDGLTEDEEALTNAFAPLSLESDDGIKKAFLDRLAELLCYEKDASLITSTALLQDNNGVTIIASRNSRRGKTWSDKDIEMLEYLAQALERFSSEGLCIFHGSKSLAHRDSS